MGRKIAPLLIWLTMSAIVASLFLRGEAERRAPLILTEQGVQPEFSPDGGGLFSFKLPKKIKGAAIRNESAMTGRSRCRPASRGDLARQSAIRLPFFLLYHAFLFYDLI